MSLISELRRRNVFRVGIAYVIGSWIFIQVADIVLDSIGAPAWVMQALLLILVLGFAAAVFFSWAFEVTPDGLKRESAVDRSQSITRVTGRRLDRSITVMLVVALGYFVWESRIADRAPGVDQATVEATGQTQTETAPDVVSDERISIAVLPFENRSALVEDEFFTEGIHDDLLTTISKISSMRVISRTSVMKYKDSTENIREIAEELGVEYILEGGVQRAGNMVRINVQLIGTATDEHLWAEIYDRELTAENIFLIQSEISQAIAEALRATLSPEEQEKINVVQTRNLEAYESYLLGRKLWTSRTAENNAESVKHFQRAIDLDPGYALAYVGLSDAYRFKVEKEGIAPDGVYPLAERALQMALQLDDQLGEAYASRGALKMKARDYAGADADYMRAIELNPNHLPTYNWYALSLSSQGRLEDALAIYRKGLALDPLSAIIRSNIGYNLVRVGRFDEARKTFERGIEMHPGQNSSYGGMATFHAGVRGRIDDAVLWDSKALAVDPTDALTMAIMAFWYNDLGDFDTAEQWLDRSIIAQPDNGLQKVARLDLEIHRDDMVEATVLANDVYERMQETDNFGGLALSLLRDNDIANGRYDDAYTRYEAIFPEIVGADTPHVHRSNCFQAVDIAYLYIRSGREEQGRQLLEAAIPVIDATPILGFEGSAWGKARVYALLGRKDEALAELQRGVDAGWRIGWHNVFDREPIFDSLRDAPEFAAMRAKIATDMAGQLRRVRELEASDEIMRPEDLEGDSDPNSAS